MHVLIVTIEAGGNLPPVLSLTRQLVQRGHKVTLLGEPCLAPLAENQGAGFVAFREHFTKTDRRKDIFEDWKSKNNGFENVIFGPSEIVVRETLEVLRTSDADLLVADVVIPAAAIAGEVMGIPRVSLFHMPEYLPGANRPPGGLGLLPGKGTLGRFRDRMAGKILHRIFNKYLPRINAIRRTHQLPEMKNITELFTGADLRMIQTSPAFDFPLSPLPANVRYTGPVLDDPDWVEPWMNPWSADDSRPLVVVSLSSTFQNQKQVIARCIEALGTLDVRVLVTLGLALEDEVFQLPDNVRVIRSGSHAQIFPHASCVITHAGHGTVMRALSHGLPLVCLPMGRDQNDNAAKVVYHGAGRMLSPRSSAAAIRKAVHNILQDQRYAEKARALGKYITEDARNGDMVAELERVYSGKNAPIFTAQNQ